MLVNAKKRNRAALYVRVSTAQTVEKSLADKWGCQTSVSLYLSQPSFETIPQPRGR